MSRFRDVEGLLKIFTFDRKADLERYCRDLVVYQSDFVAFVLACDAGRLPLRHKIHFRDYVPEHLEPSESQREALAANGVGPLKGEALKMVRKMFQLFEERRHLVGHMFFTPDLSEWHFLYFDQRDVTEGGPNHWKGGSHVHLLNWLWPEYSAESLWNTFTSGRAKPGGSFHIRYSSRDDEP